MVRTPAPSAGFSRGDDEVLLEVRAGAGGEDARAFCADLVRMYERHCKRAGWRCETLDAREDAPGLRSASLLVRGPGAGVLRGEHGGHSIQHLTRSRNKDRIHTSTATVTVLDRELLETGRRKAADIRRSDLREDFFRGSGPGGQHRNKTDSAVRLTHVPTGETVTVTSGRHRERNRQRALEVLAARLAACERDHADRRLADRRAGASAARRGDQIRVYDLVRDMVRCRKSGKVRGVRRVLDGDLEPLLG